MNALANRCPTGLLNVKCHSGQDICFRARITHLAEHIVNKSCGADRIPNKMLRLAAIIIKDPLTKLFNKSLSEGAYPSLWKHAKIPPINKNKGAQSYPKNYRPISHQYPILSKVFEKLVLPYKVSFYIGPWFYLKSTLT